MGTYKCDVIAVVKMGAYIHGVLIFYGCLLSRFMVYIQVKKLNSNIMTQSNTTIVYMYVRV